MPCPSSAKTTDAIERHSLLVVLQLPFLSQRYFFLVDDCIINIDEQVKENEDDQKSLCHTHK